MKFIALSCAGHTATDTVASSYDEDNFITHQLMETRDYWGFSVNKIRILDRIPLHPYINLCHCQLIRRLRVFSPIMRALQNVFDLNCLVKPTMLSYGNGNRIKMIIGGSGGFQLFPFAFFSQPMLPLFASRSFLATSAVLYFVTSLCLSFKVNVFLSLSASVTSTLLFVFSFWWSLDLSFIFVLCFSTILLLSPFQ